jgi:hypothetical protein
MRARLAALGAALAVACLVAGCGSTAGNACLPARVPAPGDCPSTTFADGSESDPICLDQVSGTAICRGSNDAVCYVCTGADFTDGCEVHGSQTIECVHSCDNC